jgi:hypothetical protein
MSDNHDAALFLRLLDMPMDRLEWATTKWPRLRAWLLNKNSAKHPMTPEVEAHWRYQLERMTNYGHDLNHISAYRYPNIPDEVAWLREEARYQCHLANAQKRRAATFVGVIDE